MYEKKRCTRQLVLLWFGDEKFESFGCPEGLVFMLLAIPRGSDVVQAPSAQNVLSQNK
ncbi:hypothetical protein PIIN_10110 [Serendipita indica DSM 11827]|uniref:Uncharacterized protein n=1 Tax=Serendipita indica (strain DSM 11827) TaxID=1109443 RepID=G4TXR7_SERID|nr:hypothetical protein PIIN_10110 [Serendipita indica DSM 11827]